MIDQPKMAENGDFLTIIRKIIGNSCLRERYCSGTIARMNAFAAYGPSSMANF
ncbi:MAG: hypothetical protein ABJQ41_12495 [Marinomonas sp.]